MPISPRASAIGLPALRASSCASDSSSASSASASARSAEARAPGASSRQARERGAGPRDGLVDLLDAGARDLLEHRLGGGLDHCERVAHRYVGISAGSAGVSTSGSSTVLTGPLNVFLAPASHAIQTPAITTIVTSGA